MELSQEQIQFFKENGFLKVENIIDKKRVDTIAKTMLMLAKKFTKDDFEGISEENIFENQKFHDAMTKLKKENPVVSGMIYDSLQGSLALDALLMDEKMQKAVSQLSNEDIHNHSFVNTYVRIDIPNDDKNKLDWHQDFCSSEHVLDHRNGLVAWIPLVDANEKNGTIIICPKSHNELNAKDMIVNERIGANHSEYLFFPESIANKYEKIFVDTKMGDVIFIPMTITHSSGTNTSNRVRFTALGRYYPMSAKDFPPGRRMYVFSKTETNDTIFTKGKIEKSKELLCLECRASLQDQYTISSPSGKFYCVNCAKKLDLLNSVNN